MRQIMIAVMMISAMVATAQHNSPQETVPSRIDLFAGYSVWLPKGSIETVPFTDDTHGLIISGAYYLNANFGLELDGDYHFDNNDDFLSSVAVGPILRRPVSRGFSVFAHALIGAADIIGPDAPLIGGYGYRQGGADWGPQVTLGGGVDYSLPYFHHRLALRLIQADYLYDHVNFGPGGGLANLNSARFSTGLVLRLGSMVPPPPVTFACAATPQAIYAGDPLSVIGVATNLDPHKKATFRWIGLGASTNGSETIAAINSDGLGPGTYAIKGYVSEGHKPGQSADCRAEFQVMAFEPPTVLCSADHTTVHPGDTATITARGVSPQNRPLHYSYSTSAGSIAGDGSTATLSSMGAPAGAIVVSCSAADDKGHTASATTSVHVEAPPPPPTPKTLTLCSIDFGRDRKRPARVNNEAKACLDDVALSVKRQPDAILVLVGNSVASELRRAKSNELAAQRSIHTKDYLVKEKGIDPARIQARRGISTSEQVDTFLVPAGATFDNDISGTTVVDEGPISFKTRR